MNNDYTRTEPDIDAYCEELKTFVNPNTPAWEIRKLLGLPKLENPSNVGFNIKWNKVRVAVRKVFTKYDLDALEDVEVQIQLAHKIENVALLKKYTNEPRKYTEWFRQQYIRNEYRSNTAKEKRRRDSAQSADVENGQEEGSAVSGTNTPPEGTAGGENAEKSTERRGRGYWDVVYIDDS
ncbi:hypothetical protein TWF481_008466 [Arthrobotrys musiformis]|uniref:Uncharacterized protein n=1 Tax=Arthrobotrys musiformis TaxID=47236 RepID=A0AAV9W782_9PEZI